MNGPPAAEVRSEMPRNSAGGAGLVVPQRPAPTTYEKKPAATVVTPDTLRERSRRQEDVYKGSGHERGQLPGAHFRDR